MKTPHYLRFVQALLLAAAVPACSSASTPPSTEVDDKAPAEEKAKGDGPAAPTDPAVATAPRTPADAHADAGADASLPFSSGPVVPPELPVSFA